MPMVPKTVRANLLLLLTAAIWGFAFVAQRAAVAFVGSFSINAVRFALGALVLAPFARIGSARRDAPEQAALLTSNRTGVLLTGVVLFLAVTLQQQGLETTTAGKAGFITGLYVVLVPLMDALRGRPPRWLQGLSVVAAGTGLYLLTVTGGLNVQRGDVLVFLGAVLWAVHVQLVGWLSREVAPLHLALAQFIICALLSTGSALLLEAAPFSGLLQAAVPLLYAGVLSVGVAYSFQVLGQRDADPTPAAVIMSLEAVFAAVGGWLLLGERLTSRAMTGALLMLGAMLLAQLPPRRIFDRLD